MVGTPKGTSRGTSTESRKSWANGVLLVLLGNPAPAQHNQFTLCMIAYVGCFVVGIFVSPQSGFKLASFSQQGAHKAESARGRVSISRLPASCRRHRTPSMANSRFQYVKKFELSDALLPDTYLIARLDGHRFTKFTKEHGFTKPNDERGLLLMAEVGHNSRRVECCIHIGVRPILLKPVYALVEEEGKKEMASKDADSSRGWIESK